MMDFSTLANSNPPALDVHVKVHHIWYNVLNRVYVHNDATDDLKKIQAVDPTGFNCLVALIDQMRTDPALVAKLLDHGYGRDQSEDVSVMKWMDIERIERTIVWRIKFWDLEDKGLKYRIFYFYYFRDLSYNIMAVLPRDEIDYDDPNHPTRKRIIRRIREEFPNG